jgi:mRNA-degrading endonuclease RelE of RelBE toxin-antitoxin system
MAKQGRKGSASRPTKESSELPYQVDMVATAEAVYKHMARLARAAEQAGDFANAHCTAFNMVHEAIHKIIPHDPLSRSYALRGELSNIFRIRKGRIRICWIASSKIRRICILFIAETLRKEGDANDPYAIFQNLVDSGVFDDWITKYGVRIPPRRSPPRPKPN